MMLKALTYSAGQPHTNKITIFVNPIPVTKNKIISKYSECETT